MWITWDIFTKWEAQFSQGWATREKASHDSKEA